VHRQLIPGLRTRHSKCTGAKVRDRGGDNDYDERDRPVDRLVDRETDKQTGRKAGKYLNLKVHLPALAAAAMTAREAEHVLILLTTDEAGVAAR